MTVAIDSSKAYRWPSELVELINAVTSTDPNNESTWIEWKSTLDLDDKSGHHHIAKHILGFANRTVTTARRHADGHAYLVVGAEPGTLAGVAPVDQAVLTPRIARYVGSEVRWRAEYIGVREQQVLVIVVDPPRHGDPIFPLRRQLGDHPKGRIFVRRAGHTELADDFEVDELVRRARGTDSLGIAIEPTAPVIERRPELPDADRLADVEKSATLARPSYQEQVAMPWGPGAGIARYAVSLGRVLQTPDDRNKEDYQNEVNGHRSRYKRAIQERCVWRLWNHQPFSLQLEILNLTDDNFTDIRIELHVPGDVHSWPEDLRTSDPRSEPGLPNRPDVLGTPRPMYGFGSNRLLSAVQSPRFPSTQPPTRGPGVEVHDTGSVTINYSGIDLRPHENTSLSPVRLLVEAQAGTVLDCEWKATAGNARGQLTGRFAMTIGEPTLSFEDIERDAEPDQ